MTTYLGFSCSQHDPAIAVVDEAGEVLFAQANERALKYKRGWHAAPDAFGLIEPILDSYAQAGPVSANLTWSGNALRSVRYLAPLCRWGLGALDLIGASDLEAKRARGWVLRHGLYRAPTSVIDLLLNLELRLNERRHFRSRLTKKGWNHHLCHAATASFSSPFEDGLCVVMDGMGEGSSTSVFSFRDGRLKRLDSPGMANLASLGIFYGQVCFAAGFDPVAGEEWKLMGLAAYGRLDEGLYRRMRSAVTVKGGHLSLARDYAAVIGHLLPFRQRPHMANADMAFTAQKVFEDVLFEFLNQAHRRWGGENLILTGGCALNSSANGKILGATPFRRLHVPMAPGDDGNAVGAALLAWQAAHRDRPVPRFSTPYLGSVRAQDSLERLCRHGIEPCLQTDDPDRLTDHVAARLADGAIVGFMQGRAEFGPRALGNRSILADPRSPGIRDRLNASVKFREEFRPFAPSILHEFGPDYFQDYAESPYMERTLKWLPGRAPPGVRHVDDTGRLQSVTEAGNPLFHKLISAFHRKTGLPILLNTSFNVMGRPMIHDTEDALGVFFTSDIDLLVLGNIVFQKPGRTGRS
ncbi:carbamoyltransferase [Mesorhizobium sp. BH1-1-5]|uniref:carbamoyltransferase family protein n=1 Tax=Mesorhizobium sp. BH1-1-5 TaxID=2876661 RepID=UPI001CC9DF4C|nr:carbamoyltransferase C-terminal domain-containing protein [Mesorhizobium sp. BH1-1-5]MBZ9989788.1 carbamoyltransferase [Mesorhizobium sp. BH1-1-5]